MKTQAEFRSAVDAELDARCDPFANERIQAWILEHPEDALQLADLRAGLALLARTPVPLRAKRRSRAVPLAAAAALLALGIYAGTRAFERATPALTAVEELVLHPVAPAPGVGSVQWWEIVSTSTSADSTQTVRAREGRISIENERSVRGVALARAHVLAMHAESWSPQ